MAENKKGFVLYADQKLIFDDLTNEEAGILIKHIFSYVNDENPIMDNRFIDMAFKPIKLQLKRDLIKYQAVKERNVANARKRWDAVASSGIPNDTKNADNVNDNVNVNVNDNVKVKDINISFDCFWNLYNKKIGDKKKIENKWNKLKDEERQKIIDTLPTFLNSITDKQFQPFPETYLNNKRWNDEFLNTEKKQYNFITPNGHSKKLLTESEYLEIKKNSYYKEI